MIMIRHNTKVRSNQWEIMKLVSQVGTDLLWNVFRKTLAIVLKQPKQTWES